MKDEVSKLTQLGNDIKYDRYSNPTSEILEVFPNQYPNRDYQVQYIFNEFTSRCPKTGQPDFATIAIVYVPDAVCIETKSLKLYFLAYRDEGMFMETIVNKILEDLVKVSQPRVMEVIGNFNVRGGTAINVKASYTKGQ